jgi:hypothetical protein
VFFEERLSYWTWRSSTVVHSVVYVPWAEVLLDEIRGIDRDLGIEYTDQEFYDYLPKRLSGFTWASVPIDLTI